MNGIYVDKIILYFYFISFTLLKTKKKNIWYIVIYNGIKFDLKFEHKSN